MVKEKPSQRPNSKKIPANGQREALSTPEQQANSPKRSKRSPLNARTARKFPQTVKEKPSQHPNSKQIPANGQREALSTPEQQENSRKRSKRSPLNARTARKFTKTVKEKPSQHPHHNLPPTNPPIETAANLTFQTKPHQTHSPQPSDRQIHPPYSSKYAFCHPRLPEPMPTTPTNPPSTPQAPHQKNPQALPQS